MHPFLCVVAQPHGVHRSRVVHDVRSGHADVATLDVETSSLPTLPSTIFPALRVWCRHHLTTRSVLIGLMLFEHTRGETHRLLDARWKSSNE